MSKVVVALSGGLDSTVLATLACKQFEYVRAISFFYGQRHERELDAARQVAIVLNIPHQVIDVSATFRAFIDVGSKSSLLKMSDVPEGHYAHENMVQTIVPNRNMIFLSILAGIAVSWGADKIGIAAHNGDAAIYPDCRPDFLWNVQNAIQDGNDSPNFDVWCPFLFNSKADIVRVGDSLDSPIFLTRSCYNDGPMHCGRCSTCVERIEAFIQAGVQDFTRYLDTTFAARVLAEWNRDG